MLIWMIHKSRINIQLKLDLLVFNLTQGIPTYLSLEILCTCTVWETCHRRYIHCFSNRQEKEQFHFQFSNWLFCASAYGENWAINGLMRFIRLRLRVKWVISGRGRKRETGKGREEGREEEGRKREGRGWTFMTTAAAAIECPAPLPPSSSPPSSAPSPPPPPPSPPPFICVRL